MLVSAVRFRPLALCVVLSDKGGGPETASSLHPGLPCFSPPPLSTTTSATTTAGLRGCMASGLNQLRNDIGSMMRNFHYNPFLSRSTGPLATLAAAHQDWDRKPCFAL